MTDKLTFADLGEGALDPLDEFTIVVTKLLIGLQERQAVPVASIAEYFIMQGVALALVEAKMSESDLAILLARARSNVSRAAEMVRKRKAGGS